MAYQMPMRRPVAQRAQVPLRSLLGKPGKFYDTRTKKVYDISQAYEGEKYDTVLVAAGAQAPGTQYLWFQNLQNKTRIDTNFRTQNRLDPNERLVLERIGLYLHTAVGAVVNILNDIRLVLDNSFVRLTINDDILWEGLATWLPSGYGLYGATSENLQSIVSIGVPGTAAAARLRRKQMITTEHSLGGELDFLARAAWIGGYANPAPTTFMALKLILHGPISRPATR
jgi:predicted NBD/HSP70 family sugar kinase